MKHAEVNKAKVQKKKKKWLDGLNGILDFILRRDDEPLMCFKKESNHNKTTILNSGPSSLWKWIKEDQMRREENNLEPRVITHVKDCGNVTRITEMKAWTDKLVCLGRTVHRLDEWGEKKKKDESNITFRILTCTGGLMLELITNTLSW